MEPGEGEMPAEETGFQQEKGPRPDFRVVQAEYNTRIGKTLYRDVGAMWRNTSKAGNEFYTMKIGKLRLLVFRNDSRGATGSHDDGYGNLRSRVAPRDRE